MSLLIALLIEEPRKVSDIKDYFRPLYQEYDIKWNYVANLASRNGFSDINNKGVWTIPENFNVDEYISEDF